MNAAYIHIAINTFPPILNLTALLILFVGVIRQSVPIMRTALVVMLFAVLFGVPTFLSGQRAEDIVENMEGVNAVAIDPHEESAEWTLGMFIIEGLFVLAALLVGARRVLPRWLPVIVLLVGLLTTTAVFRTAYLGGKIHHPETRMKALGARP